MLGSSMSRTLLRTCIKRPVLLDVQSSLVIATHCNHVFTFFIVKKNKPCCCQINLLNSDFTNSMFSTSYVLKVAIYFSAFPLSVKWSFQTPEFVSCRYGSRVRCFLKLLTFTSNSTVFRLLFLQYRNPFHWQNILIAII